MSGADSLADLAKSHTDTRLVEIGPVVRTDNGAAAGLNAQAVGARRADTTTLGAASGTPSREPHPQVVSLS